MKTLSAIRLLVAATMFWAGLAAAQEAPASLKGVVLESRDAGGYTYLRLKTGTGETWAAVNQAPVTKGAEVTLMNVMVMTDFESKSLKKTFPTILFATLAGAEAGAAGSKEMSAAHAGLAKTPALPDVRVARATGANARTVAEIVGQGAQLKDKPVRLRARVVKYNPGIMGRNWLHLRDGSGSEAAGSNDILVTTAAASALGEVVTVQGTVRTDKDFGAGYVYKVLIEDATLSR
mgnify:CR=1 FL=1